MSLLVYIYNVCYITCIWWYCIIVYIVKALKDIAKTLGKTDLNFSVDPCSGLGNWRPSPQVKGRENAVNCSSNCSSVHVNDTECHEHVTSM